MSKAKYTSIVSALAATAIIAGAIAYASSGVKPTTYYGKQVAARIASNPTFRATLRSSDRSLTEALLNGPPELSKSIEAAIKNYPSLASTLSNAAREGRLSASYTTSMVFAERSRLADEADDAWSARRPASEIAVAAKTAAAVRAESVAQNSQRVSIGYPSADDVATVTVTVSGGLFDLYASEADKESAAPFVKWVKESYLNAHCIVRADGIFYENLRDYPDPPKNADRCETWVYFTNQDGVANLRPLAEWVWMMDNADEETRLEAAGF